MKKKFALALCAALLLTGCNNSPMEKHPITPTSYISHIAEFETEIGDRIFFAYNSSFLSEEAQRLLVRQVEWLDEHPSFSITIEGHCDERGTREYNIALGERRAYAVKNFLMHHGISADRLETISYGKERPAVIGNSEMAWSQNRRAVTSLR